MNDLSQMAVDHLARVVRDDGLFPFTSSLVRGELESSYDRPLARRYTLISLLGLHEARSNGAHGSILDDFDGLFERFLNVHGRAISNLGDQGLLLTLLARTGSSTDLRDELLQRARLAADRRHAGSIQDLAWLQLGVVEASRATPKASDVARALHSRMARDYLHEGAWFPRHSLNGLRGRIVSFGAVTYYLYALHQFAQRMGDDAALAQFETSATRLLDVQLPSGGWPWLLDAQRGVTLEIYPLFSVHQLSMAMLFLLPAAVLRIPGADDAITRSFAWVGGSNELSTPLTLDGGRFIYRSIECSERWGRGKRYVRAMSQSVARRASTNGPAVALRLNTESRSYEWGWLLWVWSGRRVTPHLTPSPGM